MEVDLLNRVFEEKLEDLQLGINGFRFYNKDEIGEGQIGYRCNGDYVKIGDLILVDINNKKLPIYSLVCDDFSICYKISNSIEDYHKILNMIANYDLSSENKVKQLIIEIKKINVEIDNDYWENFLLGILEEISTHNI